ncbi:phage tail tape measure protein [Micromonospora sp. NPDC048999]|uniref:phage tail tape measure protein n=1 Tax=Micromonospora sp. NPDC048999 TaxID=3155391 RepID=UPI0033D83D46
MSEKDLSYRLSADPREFERGFKSAEASARAMERELARLEREQAKVDAAMDKVGAAFLAGGAAIAAGLVVAAKAAVDWETAWVGVSRFLSGSPQQLADLEGQLRQLARVLPQTHQEIAGVAAAAAQLGVAKEDIAKFTKVMIDLGVSTDLSSTQAAFALARMMNIMQTAPEDVDRLGASIVALGNNFAAMESEITEMGLRIAGAGRTVRMSEADVVGFAAALAAVGVEAEAGGSAISRAFITIEQAVRSGGDKLELFARVSGMSADQFRQAWQQDAARATAAFTAGLGRMQEAGGDVFGTLNKLGLSEIRLRDALLRLAGAGDLVTRALDTANAGWDENVALLETANRRYATVEARMAIARNNLNEFAIDLGQTFLPALGKGADLVANLGAVFADLPGPVKTLIALLGLAAAGILLTGGAAMIAVPRIAAMKTALDQLAMAEGRLAAAAVKTTGALGKVGSLLAGPWGIAIGVAVTALAAFAVAQAKARGRARELSQTLDEQTGAITQDTALWIANELAQRGAIDKAEKLGISAADLTAAVLGEADAVERVNAKLDEAKVRHQGHYRETEKSRTAAKALQRAMSELGGDLDRARELHDRLTKATEGTSGATEKLEPATQQLADKLGLTADQAKDLSGAIDDLDKQLRTMLDGMFGLEEAQDAAVRAMKRMVTEAKKNKGALDGNSEAALTNRDNVRKLIAEHMKQISALAQTGASSETLTSKTAELRDQFVKQALQAGLTKEAVLEYARAYDNVPDIVTTTAVASTDEAQRRTEALIEEFKRLDGRVVRVTVQVTAKGDYHLIGQGTQLKGFAGGGRIEGLPGPPGVDSGLIAAANGEHVLTAAEVRAAGGHQAIEQWRAGLLRGTAAMQPAPRPAAAGGSSTAAGITVEQMTVQAWSERFSLAQIEGELLMYGASA